MKLSKTIWLFLLVAFFSGELFAAPILVPVPPKIKAKGYLLVDFNSGRVLAEKNADTRMEPASLTKMVSSYVIAYELREGNIKLEEEVLISKKAWKMPGSRMFAEVGKRIQVEKLLKGVIIQSGNDATVALAEHVAGSESAFAQLMNQHATSLGMISSNFVNSTGLPHKDHYTTPRDMQIVAHALIRDFPEHYKWYSIKEYKFNGIKQYNRNKLLWRDKFVDGVKTGHTESAGYCLVASAKRENMRLISVLLGAKSENARAEESRKLLGYGFRFYETHQLYAADTMLTEVPVWKGEKKTLQLGVEEDLYLTVPRGQYKHLNASMNIESSIVAPINKGQAFGEVEIKLGDAVFAKRGLVALDVVESGSFFNNLMDEVKLLFE